MAKRQIESVAMISTTELPLMLIHCDLSPMQRSYRCLSGIDLRIEGRSYKTDRGVEEESGHQRKTSETADGSYAMERIPQEWSPLAGCVFVAEITMCTYAEYAFLRRQVGRRAGG